MILYISGFSTRCSQPDQLLTLFYREFCNIVSKTMIYTDEDDLEVRQEVASNSSDCISLKRLRQWHYEPLKTEICNYICCTDLIPLTPFAMLTWTIQLILVCV